MMQHANHISISLAMLLLLSGCGLTQTTYEKPPIIVPALWQNGNPATQKNQSQTNAWWRDFNNDELSRLVDDVLAHNNDLTQSALKVKEARLKADLALDQYLPDLSSATTLSNSRGLRRSGTISRSYSASVNASYEVDLWGKLASQKDAADWEAQATEQDMASARTTLIGTTVDLYWKIAYLNERIALSADSIAYQKKTLDLVRVRHATGADSAVKEADAARSLAVQEAAHTQYVQQKIEAANAFNILFDIPPEITKADPQKLPQSAIPPVAENLPASVLERRPDLRAAEQRLRESLSGVDATRASYLPDLSLTGSLGSSSVALTKVLTDPVGTLGAGITLPFLNWMDMRNNVAVSQTQYEEAVIAFRQTLYSALADVENALSARVQDTAQGEKLAEAVTQAQKAEKLYEIQYKQGYVALQSWLDAQEKRRSAEAAALDNRYTQLNDSVTLYKALGGDPS